MNLDIGLSSTEGRKSCKSWQFDTPKKMGIFWIQLRAALLKRSPSKVIYEWSPSFWWLQADPRLAKKTVSAMSNRGETVFSAFGSKAFPLPASKSYICYLKPGKFRKDAGVSYAIIDGWLLTASLPKAVAKTLNDKRMNIRSLLNQPCKAVVTLERGSPSEKKMRANFYHHFWNVVWADL